MKEDASVVSYVPAIAHVTCPTKQTYTSEWPGRKYRHVDNLRCRYIEIS